MNEFKVRHLFLFVLPFLLCACSSTKYVEKTPPSRLVGITLAKSIDRQDTRGIPVDVTTDFSTLDDEVIAHVELENISGRHQLRWDWHDPKGNVYYSTGNYPVEASRGKYLPELTAWHSLAVQGDKAVNYPGQWEVKVYLDDSLMESRSFSLNAMSDVDEFPATGLKPYPKDWGLIIGIEDYSSLPSVDYARKDAVIIREYLNKILGVPEENIIALIDGDATKGRIEGYLKQYLPANVAKDSTLYVYYAGHGAPDMEKGEPYLVPYDGDTRFLMQTGYKLKSFYEDLDSLKLQRVYVFLDSCFSGVASRAAEMLTKGARPALVHVEDVNIDSDNLIAFSASKSNEVSNAYPETRHGLFTYYLLRALRGEADANDDQWVSVKEAFTFVKEHVTRTSRRMGTEQTPVIMPSLDVLKDLAISRSLR